MMATKKTVTHGMYDSFSGPAAQLPLSRRTPGGVLEALRINPRISTFDMIDTPWLRRCIHSLKSNGQITEDKDEPYPWHLYYIVAKQEGGEPA